MLAVEWKLRNGSSCRSCKTDRTCRKLSYVILKIVVVKMSVCCLILYLPDCESVRVTTDQPIAFAFTHSRDDEGTGARGT